MTPPAPCPAAGGVPQVCPAPKTGACPAVPPFAPSVPRRAHAPAGQAVPTVPPSLRGGTGHAPATGAQTSTLSMPGPSPARGTGDRGSRP